MARPAKITPDAVNMAVFALSRLMPKSSVKKLLAQKFDLKARSCETVLARAREQMRQTAGVTVDEIRGDALHMYRSIISDSSADLRLKLLAMDSIVKLFGAARPERIELSGPDGKAMQTEAKFSLEGASVEELKVLRTVLARQRPGGGS